MEHTICETPYIPNMQYTLYMSVIQISIVTYYTQYLILNISNPVKLNLMDIINAVCRNRVFMIVSDVRI